MERENQRTQEHKFAQNEDEKMKALKTFEVLDYFDFEQRKKIGIEQKPNTLSDYILLKLEEELRDKYKVHLRSLPFFYISLQLKEQERFQIVKPTSFKTTEERKMYIEAFKKYKELEKDNCVRKFVFSDCSINISVFQTNNDEIPLKEFLKLEKVSEYRLLNFAQQLLKRIQLCHKKLYFLQNIDLNNIFVDVRNKSIKPLNPLQKILLEYHLEYVQQQKIKQMIEDSKLVSKRSLEILANHNNNSWQNYFKKNQYTALKVGQLIDIDTKAFAESIFAAACSNNYLFEQQIEENMLSAYFERNFQGTVTKKMQYFLAYLWAVSKYNLSPKFANIELMIAQVLYSEIKQTQAKQLIASLSSQKKIDTSPSQQTASTYLQTDSTIQHTSSSTLQTAHISLKAASTRHSTNNISQNINKISHTPSHSSQSFNTQGICQLLAKQKSEILLSTLNKGIQFQKTEPNDNKPILSKGGQQFFLNPLPEKIKSYFQTGKSIEQNRKDQVQKAQNIEKPGLSRDLNSPIQKQNQIQTDFNKTTATSKNRQLSRFDIINQTFKQNDYQECVSDQTKWMQRIDTKINNYDEAIYALRKIQKKPNKTAEEHMLQAWILFKYDNFFNEPLQILIEKVLGLENMSSKEMKKAKLREQDGYLNTLLCYLRQTNNKDFTTQERSIQSECITLIGRIYFKQKSYDHATLVLKAALKLNTQNQLALYYLGKSTIISEGQIEKGMQYFYSLLRVNPFNEEIIRKITKFIFKRLINDCSISEVYFFTFLYLMTNKKCPKTLLLMINTFYKKSNYLLAKFLCIKGIEQFKEREFYYTLGVIYWTLNKVKHGIRFFLKAHGLGHRKAAMYLCFEETQLYLYHNDLEELEIASFQVPEQNSSQRRRMIQYLY